MVHIMIIVIIVTIGAIYFSKYLAERPFQVRV